MIQNDLKKIFYYHSMTMEKEQCTICKAKHEVHPPRVENGKNYGYYMICDQVRFHKDSSRGEMIQCFKNKVKCKLHHKIMTAEVFLGY